MVNVIISVFLALALAAGCQKPFVIPDPVDKPDSGDTPELPVSEESVYPSGGDITVSDLDSFNAALKSASPGTIILWADGTYSDVAVKMQASGQDGAPIILRAQTPGKVVFTGRSSITLNGSYLVAEGFSFTDLDTSVKGTVLTCSKGSHDCRFSYCKIDGKSSKPSEVDTKWVSLYGTHNEISHCTFLEKKNMGCLLVVWMEDGIVPEHSILNNYFYRPYTHYDDNGKARNSQESIRIGTSDFSMSPAKCIVKGNHFYRCHGERAEIISNKSCFNLYEGNLFEEGEGSLTLRHGNDCVVRGNYFLSGGKTEVGGVRIIGERHLVENNYFFNLTGTNYKAALCVVKGESNAALNGYWTAKDCTVRNNLFVDCQQGFVINYGARDTQDSAPVNLKITGNTLISSKSYMIPVNVIAGTPADAVVWDGNVIYGGTQKGVSLETVKTAPGYEDQTTAIQSIRDNAGAQW
ncbi:MAG: polysaccharide lyase 6 family protein [Bacteroidales bacterium]|nr:polysaccharide lyase 6 family protein [Bacteroidales bacterium]